MRAQFFFPLLSPLARFEYLKFERRFFSLLPSFAPFTNGNLFSAREEGKISRKGRKIEKKECRINGRIPGRYVALYRTETENSNNSFDLFFFFPPLSLSFLFSF